MPLMAHVVVPLGLISNNQFCQFYKPAYHPE